MRALALIRATYPLTAPQIEHYLQSYVDIRGVGYGHVGQICRDAGYALLSKTRRTGFLGNG
jgi:hypothetical protein